MKRSELQEIVARAQQQLKDAGKSIWNLSLLSKMTGISRPTLRKCRDEGFAHRHGNKGRKRASKLDGHTQLLDEKLKSGITNSDVLLSVLRKAGYEGGLTTIKTYVAKNRHLCPNVVRNKKVSQGNRGRRYKLEAGDCFQMDWGFVNAVDNDGGLHKLACFVMVCGHCGKRYLEFFTNARQENLLIGMLHGFAYLGGIPKRVMTDNMKSVCVSRSGPNIVWNATYLDFMQLLGFTTTLAKPYHAFTKGRVERLVRYMKDNFVPGVEFDHLGDLNQQALGWCNEKNGLMHKGLYLVPNERHASEEFSPLPTSKVLFHIFAPERSVSFDGFVDYEGYRYGVPMDYTAKKARVMREGSRVSVLAHDGRLLSSHHLDWVHREYWCSNQWEDADDQPQERPSQPPRPVVMNYNTGASQAKRVVDLSIYDRLVTSRGGNGND